MRLRPASGGGGIRTLEPPNRRLTVLRRGGIGAEFRSGSGFVDPRHVVRCTMCCTEPRFPATYEAVHRYDRAVIQRGRQELLVPCVVQPRDVALVRDVRRYKFLTAPQLRELWWPESSVQAGDRRLLKLFRAGYLDRFRPISRRGSFPWTYQLGLEATGCCIGRASLDRASGSCAARSTTTATWCTTCS
jgi:hypothetical protein